MKTMLMALAWFVAAGVGAQTGEPAAQISATPVSCFGRTDGSLELTLTSGSAPVNFQWNNLNNGASGSGTLLILGQPVAVPNLSAGDYRLTLTGANGSTAVATSTIAQPSPFGGKLFVFGNFGGFPVSCVYDGTAVAVFNAFGGTPPYTYLWSNGDTDLRADSLMSGPLSVSATDANGCAFAMDTMLELPKPLDLRLEVVGETCFGQNNGSIRVASAQGGISPYRFSLNGGPLTASNAWVNLPPSPYFIQMEDAAGCTLDAAALLPSGLEFILKLGPDTAIFSGDTLRRFILTDPPAERLVWQPAYSLEVLAPDEVLLFPNFTTAYRVTAINADGCTASGVLTIEVIRQRDIYVPNVFAPKGDLTENQTFTVFGGGGIETVALLQVYDRVGRLWFENRNFPANTPSAGWDGAFHSSEAPSGVYLWRAIVRYTDGREILQQGDVTVVR